MALSSAIVGCGEAGSRSTEATPADLVLTGGQVFTVEEALPRATAFAVTDGRIVAVGSDEHVEEWIGPETRRIALEGRAVLPGLIDGHVHLESGASLVRGVDLTGIPEREEWLRRIAARAAELTPGAWIVGGRWDHTLTLGAAWPTKEELDAVAPDHPVSLSHIDGHYTWVNSLALSLGGVTASTPDPEGGRVERDPSTGEATGILLETASGLVSRHIPAQSDDERLATLRETLRRANALGLTGAHNMTGLGRVPDYLTLAEEGALNLRVWHGATGAADDMERLLAVRADVRSRMTSLAGGPRFEIGYVKLMADGVLSARTAALIDPYADAPAETGLPRWSQEELNDQVAAVNEAGIPAAIHAIGDRAVQMSLDAFEASRDAGLTPALPNRIEHIEVVTPEDATRFQSLGVWASMNPHHCITGIDVYNTDRLGPDRAEWSFPWGRLRANGARLVFGSDWATAPLDPLQQLYAATLREKPAGGPEGGWHPDNRLTFDQALAAYTLAPAAAAGWDGEIGSISLGKWADFVVLDGSLPEPMDRSILERRVAATYLAGEAVYEASR